MCKSNDMIGRPKKIKINCHSTPSGLEPTIPKFQVHKTKALSIRPRRHIDIAIKFIDLKLHNDTHAWNIFFSKQNGY